MIYKKIFISGGAGVIGTALVTKLLGKNLELFVGDLKPCPKQWVDKLHYREGDLNSITFNELNDFKPDLVFHLAATFERSIETPPFFEENYHHNVNLSHHLLTTLKQLESLKRFIFASSYLIYDSKQYLFQDSVHDVTALNETSYISPRNICGAAKLFFESELEFISTSTSISTASARIFRVYGRDSRDIISRWIKALKNNEEITIYRPEGKFDYIFADDVACGLLKIAESDYSGIVNLGTGHARSVTEVLNILKQHFPNMKSKTIDSNISFEASSADMEKFHRITRWSPPTSLEEGIAKLVHHDT
jgi:carbamoyl-phosphate synthase large subunit